MPMYLYKCKKCGEFEKEHSSKEKLEKCPTCEEEVERLIGKTTFILNGSCWGKDNYS